MPGIKVKCLVCSAILATITGTKFIMSIMKAISIVEINDDGSKDIKCHGCHNWNSFDKAGLQIINHKRKSQDVLNNSKKK